MLILIASIIFLLLLLPWALFSFLIIVFLIRYYPLSPLAWLVVMAYLLITIKILFSGFTIIFQLDIGALLDQIQLYFRFL